jgi:hypothetical protein
LANFVLDAGELDYAESLSDEALTASREIEYKRIIAHALGTRGIISLLRDDIQSAGAQLQEAVATAREAHDVETAALLLSVAGSPRRRRRPCHAFVTHDKASRSQGHQR